MLHQPRYDPFEPSPFFADGRVMQWPPDGTVPTSRSLAGPDVTRGYDERGYTDAIPVKLDDALLARGRDRYEVFCSPCHGIKGDAESVIAKNMPLVRPRNLLLPRIRAYPPGRIYRVINEGYGLMPSYNVQLSLEDRWAVAAYVRALQLSQNVALSELPLDIASAARKALP
jgi:mono/diheme cytochrome c family protein